MRKIRIVFIIYFLIILFIIMAIARHFAFFPIIIVAIVVFCITAFNKKEKRNDEGHDTDSERYHTDQTEHDDTNHSENAGANSTIIICDYCGSRFDTSKHSCCPHCGGPFGDDDEWKNIRNRK